ncbi:MAG: Replicative DNA helicase [Candidatus Gottesmanbacteria bacterium GW2011_GWB1_43_11]|uniref:Replicative DNA helicase n=1 Tax=Candidatus Gottesmanbacteria bacterium GW2011_GWB1_43_11 TaxID=1618446 RepID=A0A0G1CMC9_9BACT|nr:MAG: Replicative DNA helicase [Candidatus Gottesmanbacteria bacterium GW2011_GWA2_42_16]KKS54959.1 MAG: Replicative DNA helicase [Candidatus Gottesmanbacteria bacterium GW2011_GWA1_42_26]KKS82148.1 MAG: Replicative DNA helicase [Candidatus Gottesmanbacteria bacterium GW2011_GWC1_43_10]KKS86664.1 MAG: Replicative DNA helicase [Candidatus Gottesmanbacteria bacterium GW2011_GWB1_43_11]
MVNNPRVPPHDLTAEQSLLGAILLDKDALIDVTEFMRTAYFYKEAHGLIFSAMLALFEKHEPVDLVTVTAELKKLGKLKEAGGTSYLSELLNVVPTSAHAAKYGRIIMDHYVKRQLITASAKITEAAFRESGETREILDTAEQEIFAISELHTRRDFIVVKDILAGSFDRLDELHKRAGGLRGVPSGFTDLDNKLAGFQESNLLILAARPGQGKTAFALNIAQYLSTVAKIPVAIFSLEMSKEELVDRLLVAQADIDAWRLKTGKLADEDFTKLSEAMGQLAEAPLYIDDTPGLSIMEMRTKARRIQIENGIKLIMVDYLQLVDAGKKFEGRVQEVSYVSQNLKNIARELRVPVLAISQLSRAVEARGTRVPQLADLRESGAIEQDADVVMFLYREDREEGEKWSPNMLTKLLIAKHRNGPLGEIDFMFRGDRIKFYAMERKREGTAQ